MKHTRIAFAIAALALGAPGALGAAEPPSTVEGPDLAGWIVDAKTGKPPLVQAVVHATWVLRADVELAKDGKRTRRVVKEIDSVVGGRYYVVDWKQYVDLRGWKLVPGQDPAVRIYAPGYRRVVIDNAAVAKGGKRVPVNAAGDKEWKWVAADKAQALEPLPPTPGALAAELATWRRDIDRDLAAVPARERDAAIREREKLLLLFDRECRSLTPQPSACYAADSPVGRFVAERTAERSKYLVIETPGGPPRKFTLEAATTRRPRAQ
jgi:hypothetical protein